MRVGDGSRDMVRTLVPLACPAHRARRCQMLTTVVAIVSVLVGAYVNHFLSTVRFRMQLQADLIKEVSSYLATHLITVVVQQDLGKAQQAYADSTIAGEE